MNRSIVFLICAVGLALSLACGGASGDRRGHGERNGR